MYLPPSSIPASTPQQLNNLYTPQQLNTSTTKQSLRYVSVCETRVYPRPILSFQVEAQPKSRFSGIQCWSEAEVPPQEGFDVNSFL
jgi:hypothetical protein